MAPLVGNWTRTNRLLISTELCSLVLNTDSPVGPRAGVRRCAGAHCVGDGILPHTRGPCLLEEGLGIDGSYTGSPTGCDSPDSGSLSSVATRIANPETVTKSDFLKP